jgi:formamidopyrimidine-DNA glycosylase
VPELPEVETARRLIADRALHRRIVGVDDADTYVCRPHSPGQLRDALTGRMLTAAHRRGKTMWSETSGVGGSDTPGPDLGIHLGMGGRILVVSPEGETAEGGEPRRPGERPRLALATGAPPTKTPVEKPPVEQARWSRFTLEFADGGRLVLFDKRRLGRVRLNPDIDALGPDACEVTPAEFRQLTMAGAVAVKARLLDQSKIAGIGNLLADEMLWQARVSPATRTSHLGHEDADRLYAAMRAALDSAIANGGVHTGEVIPARRPGGRCPRCGAEMKHGSVGGRSTWWCSREQTTGWPSRG